MISHEEIVLRLALAAIFGAVIGLERVRKNWAAGLRTHMMVCLGAALAMMVSAFGFGDVLGQKNVVLDPSRIAAQVVSGIGFIGAGTILFLKQGVIRGLTTASGLWTVAAIGLATGGGMYIAAVVATLFAIIILWALQPFERKYTERFTRKTLKIITSDGNRSLQVIDMIMHNSLFEVSNYSVSYADGEYTMYFKFNRYDADVIQQIIKEIQGTGEISTVTWSER